MLVTIVVVVETVVVVVLELVVVVVVGTVVALITVTVLRIVVVIVFGGFPPRQRRVQTSQRGSSSLSMQIFSHLLQSSS